MFSSLNSRQEMESLMKGFRNRWNRILNRSKVSSWTLRYWDHHHKGGLNQINRSLFFEFEI